MYHNRYTLIKLNKPEDVKQEKQKYKFTKKYSLTVCDAYIFINKDNEMIGYNLNSTYRLLKASHLKKKNNPKTYGTNNTQLKKIDDNETVFLLYLDNISWLTKPIKLLEKQVRGIRLTQTKEYKLIQDVIVYDYCRRKNLFTTYHYKPSENNILCKFCMKNNLLDGYFNFNRYGTEVTPSLVL